MPHGHCYLWKPSILWLHILSDAVIVFSYYSIPLILFYFIKKRKDIPFNWVLYMFAAFIFLCGTSHIMGIITIWEPIYQIEGIVKAMTAFISLMTAICLVPLIRSAIKQLPTIRLLKERNLEYEEFSNELESQVKKRTQELEERTQELEIFNQAAINREERIIELKTEVNELLQKLNLEEKYKVTL